MASGGAKVSGMPDTERESRRFGLRPEVLARQRRLLVIAMAWYLPGSLILIGATAWAATRPGARSAPRSSGSAACR